MTGKYIEYRGNLLQRGSKAYEMYQDAKKSNNWKPLDAHMKQLEIDFRKLHHGD